MSLLSRLAVRAARAYGMLVGGASTNVSADYLVVAGGGGGGSFYGGGGGAGGLLTSTFTLSTLNTYSIAVGAGGTGGVSSASGIQGSNSSVSGTGLTTVTSTGGGYGGGYSFTGGNGGSGGGGGNAGVTKGTGTSGQGFDGSDAGGNTGGSGGGASQAGQISTGPGGINSGAGGAGTASSISGSSVTYAGGGSGAAPSGTVGAGGAGGGGAGSVSGNATSGTTNLGGGGGGAGNSAGQGGSGGSGIVIISYTSAEPKFVGGTITTSGGKQIHTFTSSGTLSPITPITASYLVVAGGGGGGYATYITNQGGGGGAGGLQASSTTLYSGATYVVTVGAGGASASGATTSGSNSSLSGTGLTTITSTGGGYGGDSRGGTAGSGGSGGGGTGAGTPGTGGAGTSGQGFAGGNGAGSPNFPGGGGGGAGAVGSAATTTVAGVGGVGVSSSISGTSTFYAGGGGGGIAISGAGGAGGNGGGGQGGGVSGSSAGTAGTPNTGGGGGGGGNPSSTNQAGGAGGSGIVIISYAGSQVFNGGLVTTSGGNTIHTFTSTGALTPLTNNLNNSLRFRSSASAYLQRTPTVTGSLTTWTASCWYKNGVMNTNETLFSNAVASDSIGFRSGRVMEIYFGAGSANLVTTQVFRDPAAWYHIVVAVDTTQATAANRIKLYVNGNQVTAFSTATYPSQNYQTSFNRSGYNQEIGRRSSDGAYPIDGYFADINWVDGQALEPYYFGNNDANGVWKPILYKGTYGTNGFYLTFGNTTSTTTLGYDSSPNGNNWTCNNISLTAGTTYDAMTDVPTNTSATVANYAVMSPLKPTSGAASLTEANLKYTYSSGTGNNATVPATIGINSGKWYHEITITSGVNIDTGYYSSETGFLSLPTAVYFTYYSNGSTGGIASSTGTVTGTPSALAVNDVIGIAFDYDNGSVTFYKNNVSQGTITGLTTNGVLLFPTYTIYSAGAGATTVVYNFGQRPFAYTPPTGYVALNTFNLPTPTILQGNKYMDATTYTGNGGTQVIVNQAQFKPDFVWQKSRSNAIAHILNDSVRGISRSLYSNLTNAEAFYTGYNVIAFNSNGFTVGDDSAGNYGSNGSGQTYVGWQWQAGQGSTSSNTSGSITSTVSVNTTAGFSIVTFTQPASGSFTVGHGLGVAPKMIIGKDRTSASTNWVVYHSALSSPQSNYLTLNTTNAVTSSTNIWNNTAPTSTVISSISGYIANSNSNTVLYCFAEISGYSKFGSYTGNGSTDGPFVYTGFRPKFVMIKCSSAGSTDWFMLDTSRDTYNVEVNMLFPNLSNAETNVGAILDGLSNGFKLKIAGGAATNTNGSTYIFMAFAEAPFKISNSR